MMWICPKCKREFKRESQSHFCSDKPNDIDSYILAQPEALQGDLFLMRDTLKAALPGTEERISWSMPTFWKGTNILHFAATKNHVGLYPGPAAVEYFAPQLDGLYHFSKGSIQIPYGRIDVALVTEIAKWCLETGNHA